MISSENPSGHQLMIDSATGLSWFSITKAIASSRDLIMPSTKLASRSLDSGFPYRGHVCIVSAVGLP